MNTARCFEVTRRGGLRVCLLDPAYDREHLTASEVYQLQSRSELGDYPDSGNGGL